MLLIYRLLRLFKIYRKTHQDIVHFIVHTKFQNRFSQHTSVIAIFDTICGPSLWSATKFATRPLAFFCPSFKTLSLIFLLSTQQFSLNDLRR